MSLVYCSTSNSHVTSVFISCFNSLPTFPFPQEDLPQTLSYVHGDENFNVVTQETEERERERPATTGTSVTSTACNIGLSSIALLFTGLIIMYHLNLVCIY